jgi:hypothetical protein
MLHEMGFDPPALRSLGLVFDEVWQCLVTQHPERATSPEMRLRLATVVLHLARDHQLSQEQIKATAVRLLMRDEASVASR